MDAIKAKMVKLSRETDIANAKANKFDDELESYKKEAEKIEMQLATVTKKYQNMESSFDVAVEDLFNATLNLRKRRKLLQMPRLMLEIHPEEFCCLKMMLIRVRIVLPLPSVIS